MSSPDWSVEVPVVTYTADRRRDHLDVAVVDGDVLVKAPGGVPVILHRAARLELDEALDAAFRHAQQMDQGFS